MNIDSGTITINDKQIGRDIDFIRNAGIIIGETQFINSMSGFDNLKILAEIQKKIGDKEIYDVLKQMGLYENRDKKVRKYSLGMKQRLRLAQAFMENPDILVLDEPFNALDKDTVVDVQKKIENEKNKGKTILLTSHDERNISILCDTVFEMDCGRIIGKEISGSLACDGYASSVSALFGCPPVTSFSQNVGLIAMTKVVNRFTIMTGAVCMILAGLLPPVGNFFASLPDSVLGGCTLMMFGTIMVSGVQMIAKCGFNQRNTTIAALSLAIGIGFTSASENAIWSVFPKVVQTVFAENVVAVVFVVSIILSLILPKDMDIKKVEEKNVDAE